MISRTAYNTRELEESLAARGIPYTVEGGSSFFSRPGVQAPLALLALCANPQVYGVHHYCSQQQTHDASAFGFVLCVCVCVCIYSSTRFVRKSIDYTYCTALYSEYIISIYLYIGLYMYIYLFLEMRMPTVVTVTVPRCDANV